MLPAGYWSYDKDRAEVLYRPKLHSGLQTASGERLLRFRLVPTRFGYDFAPSELYRWE